MGKIQQIAEELLNRYLKQREIVEKHLQSTSDLDKEDRESIEVATIQLHCDIFVKVAEIIGKCLEMTGEPFLSYITNICTVYYSFLVLFLLVTFFHSIPEF